MDVLNVRPARRSDLARLTEIYNHYVETSHATFDETPFTVEERVSWWMKFDGVRYQCWVADSAEVAMGYACSTPLKDKAAYRTSVEISVYLAHDQTGRGAGRVLCERLLQGLRQEDVHRVYALVAQPNEASMKLHQSLGFRQVSHLTEVGRKFGRYRDVIWLELALQNG